jgi:CDP-6-deoxy-D-xylo-4-hexulose-3-dehydrase
MSGMQINLVKDTISNEDVDNLISWLSTYPRLTQGPLVKEFEQNWSDYIGAHSSTFVNSGSSALLLSYYFYKLMGVNYVVVPALSWATDVAPLIQLGMRPILCDCNLDDLSLDLDHLSRILDDLSDRKVLVNIVSVLGLVPDMSRLMALKNKWNFYLLEDVCESFGSKFEGKNLGTFGDFSVHSLYYGHHLSTIEGGMICTSNDEDNDTVKMLRAHGWDRELKKEKQQELRKEHNIDDFSAAYTFYLPGFNLRATDLQAKIGIDQLKKADDIIAKRNNNFNFFQNNLKLEWKPIVRPNTLVSNFCYPIISINKEKIVERLLNSGIECRPLICGSMGTQPFYKQHFKECVLKNCSFVDEFGLYIPNNPDLTKDELEYIIKVVND